MPKFIVVNQSPSGMMHDIAVLYNKVGYETLLVCGKPNAQGTFSNIIYFTPYNRSSVLSRFISWMSFCFSAFKYLSRIVNDNDIVLLVSNPPFNLYFPLWLRKKKNAKLMLLVYDLYPEVAHKLRPRIIWQLPFSLMKWLNRQAFAKADQIFAPSKTIAAQLKNYTSSPVRAVYNWNQPIAFPTRSSNRFLAENKLSEYFTVLYSGNLGKTHDCKTILNCAASLSDKNVRFIFIGHGSGMKSVQAFKQQHRLTNILCFGWQDAMKFPHSISAGDIAWVGYLPGADATSVPSKLPYYLAAGTPVISIGNTMSEISDLLRKYDAGWTVKNDDVKSVSAIILDAMEQFPADKKRNAQKLAADLFSENNAYNLPVK